MDDEKADVERDETFSETERWAQDVLERARSRSDRTTEIENESFLQEAHTELIDEPESNSEFSRGSIVTREDIEGDESVASPISNPALEFLQEKEFFPSSLKRTRKSLVEWVIVIVGAIGLALLIKTFLFQAYYIPSPSMTPTLYEGDRILVNKLSYKLHSVNRGDLIVFDTPEAGGNDDLIKRVIGLPGEFVVVEDGRIEIDGGLLLEPYLPLNTDINSFSTPANCVNRPNENSGCRIPDEHVFVMGDNRSNSRDSRFFGPVPVEDVEGRAFIRVWPASKIKRL
ncbi:MAG: signal peptidase I [Actinomycetota bacterium]|nr:signal peptidase I [Actinomycetota bacterium]